MTLLPLTLALALAAAPRPIAPAKTSLVLHIENPRRDLPALREFLGNAGSYTATLQPSTIGRSLSGQIVTDVLDVESLSSSGVDVDRAITLSRHQSAQLFCFSATKGGVIEKRLAVARPGEKSVKRSIRGATFVGTEVGKGWREGYVKRGLAMCAASGGTDVFTALKDVADGMVGKGLTSTPGWKKAAKNLGGPALLFVTTRNGQVAAVLSASKNKLEIEGRALGPVPLLATSKEAQPFAALEVPKSLVLVRANLDRKAIGAANGPLANAIAFLVRRTCAKCPDAVEGELRAMVSKQAAGPVALVVDGLDPAAARRPMPEYFLFPHAWLVQVRDAEATAKALAKTALQLKQAGVAVEQAENGTVTLPLRDRKLQVGVRGGTLFVANNPGAAERALAALARSSPAKAEHAASARLDGPALAAALSRISILDVASSPELAALFGLSIEAGPLLKALGTVEASGDPEAGGGTRFKTALEVP